MEIINKKKEKAIKEQENLQKFKEIQKEVETKTVSSVVEKLIKQEKAKDLILQKKEKIEKDKRVLIEEKRTHFIEMKNKIKKDDKEKLNDIKEKLQKIDYNLETKKVYLFLYFVNFFEKIIEKGIGTYKNPAGISKIKRKR